MNELTRMKCVACRGGDPQLTDSEIRELHSKIPGWQLIEVDGVKRLQRIFEFKTYAQSLEFTNKIAAMAEEEDHHPLIILEWGRVSIQWWTHVVHGLHMNDFIMAARTDSLGG
jgi:4a-hydroxytetrahydrobiopterin dehydratase